MKDPYGEGFSEEANAEEQKAAVTAMAARQKELEVSVEAAEDVLKGAKDNLRQVQEHDLPELMQRLGFEDFTTSEGLKVKVEDKFRVSVTGKWQGPIMKWLRENNYAGLIERTVSMKFGKGEGPLADRTTAGLKKADIPFTDADAVNAASFKALVKERLTAGEPVPMDELGVHRFYSAKVK